MRRNYSAYKMGRKKSVADPRTLKLAKYIRAEQAPFPPASIDWWSKVPQWGMLENDVLGNCVPAAQLHMIEQQSFYETGTEIQATNADAIKLYTEEAGYVPNDPNTDNGTDMITALRYWRKFGIKVGNTGPHKAYAWMGVNLNDALEMRRAIDLFGAIFYGAELPISAQDPEVNGAGYSMWNYPGDIVGIDTPGSWGGHCVPIVGYHVATEGRPARAATLPANKLGTGV